MVASEPEGTGKCKWWISEPKLMRQQIFRYARGAMLACIVVGTSSTS